MIEIKQNTAKIKADFEIYPDTYLWFQIEVKSLQSGKNSVQVSACPKADKAAWSFYEGSRDSSVCDTVPLFAEHKTLVIITGILIWQCDSILQTP